MRAVTMLACLTVAGLVGCGKDAPTASVAPVVTKQPCVLVDSFPVAGGGYLVARAYYSVCPVSKAVPGAP